MSDEKILVTIRSRDKTLFKEEVRAVSSYNERGLFDILPEHSNFISLIKDSIILHKGVSEKQEMKIDNGVVRVFKNEIKIFLGLLKPEEASKKTTTPEAVGKK